MLRDFEYTPASELVDVLGQFGLNSVGKKYNLALLKFEVITPDSFMWRLLINEGIYYLYAEDYISSLDHVKKVFNAYLESDQWEFIDPVDTFVETIGHAVKSGYDHVFLVKSSVEDADDAQFSVDAPLGFTQ